MVNGVGGRGSGSGRLALFLVLVLAACHVSPEERLRRGTLAIASGKWDEAVSELSAGLADAPDNAPLHERLGLALVRRAGPGDAGNAEKQFREAVRLDAASSLAHVELGNLLWDSGRKDEAKEEYRRFLALPPVDDPVLAMERARVTILLAQESRRENAAESLGAVDAP